MVEAFDRIVIAVPELSMAIGQYRALLGCEPYGFRPEGGRPAAWWGLANTVIELVQAEVETARIQGIVLNGTGGCRQDAPVANPLGLMIGLCDGRRTAEFRAREGAAGCVALSVDHLVLRTGDADACISLLADQLGIRLALDKTVPEWGGRMLFFRAGRLTLEVIQSAAEAGEDSHFWGIAYQCPDLPAFSRELVGRGVALSDVRDGRKPGTLVATLKSHCLQLPTLLIQPAP